MDWGTSSTKTKATMPPYIKSFTKDIFQDAKRAYNQGPYSYNGSTVTPFSNQTRDALGGLSGLSGANSNGAGMSSALQQIMSNGGFSPDQSNSIAGMQQLQSSNGLNDLINGNGLSQTQNDALSRMQGSVYGNNSALQRTFNQGGLTGDQQSVADRYRQQMETPFDLASNPAYQSVRQQALDTQDNALSARAAAAGRYGGGMDQAILAREQGNLANRMDDAEYRNWQQRGDMAANNLAGLSQQGIGNQLGINSAQQSGLSNIASLGQQGVGNQLSAIGQKAGIQSNIFNAQQAGLNNMGQAYQTAMQPYQTQAQVGQQYEDLYTRQMQDRLRTFDAQNPFNQFQQYASLLQGAPRGQTTTQSMSPLQAGLGAGIGGLGLLGGLGII